MKKFSAHLQYHWWQYLLCVLVVIFFWCSIFSILAQPASDESVRILFVGEYWDAQPLEEAIFDYLTHATAQSISTVEIDFLAEQTDSLLPLLIAKQYRYDLIIISEPWMQDGIGQNAFGTPLPKQITQLFPSEHYYTEICNSETYSFAFLLDCTASSHFSLFYRSNTQCYLFVSSHSVNCDQATGFGEPGHDAALKTIEFLLETS